MTLPFPTAEDAAPDPAARYTATMLARITGATPDAVRRWTRRGYLLAEADHGGSVAYSFVEARVAQVLAHMTAAGMSLGQVDRVVDRLAESAPAGCRPLAEWDISPSGDTVVVHAAGQTRDAGGQLLIEFDRPAEPDHPHEAHRAVLLPFCPEGGSDEPLAFNADDIRDEATELLEQGDCLLAEQMYRSVLLSGDGEPLDHLALGECLYRRGDLAAARERFAVCLEQEPDCLAARLSLGSVYQELGEWELAAGALEGVLSQSPECPDALIPLADTYDRLGRADEAQDLRRRLLRFAPDGPWADEARARLADAGAASAEDPQRGPVVENPDQSPILQGS